MQVVLLTGDATRRTLVVNFASAVPYRSSPEWLVVAPDLMPGATSPSTCI
jgi:hypothetical protein